MSAPQSLPEHSSVWERPPGNYAPGKLPQLTTSGLYLRKMRRQVQPAFIFALLIAYHLSSCAGLGWQRSKDTDATGHAQKAAEEGGQALRSASAESQEAGQGVLRTLKEKVTAPFDSVKASSEDVLKHAQEQGRAMGDEAARRVQEARGTAAETVHEGAERLSDATDATSSKAHGMYETIKEKVAAPFHSAKHAGDNAMKQAEEAGDDLSRRATEAKDAAGRRLGEGTQQAKEAAEEGASQAHGMYDNIKGKVASSFHSVKESGNQASDDAARHVHDAKGAATEKAQQATADAASRGHTMYESIKEKVTAPFHAAKHAGDATLKQTEDLGKEASRRATEATDDAQRGLEERMQQAKDAAEEGGARVHGVYDTIKEKVSSPFHSAKGSDETVHAHEKGGPGVYRAAQDKVEEVVNKFGGAYDTAVRQSSETLDEVKARVGEAADTALKATGRREESEREAERKSFIDDAMRKLEESWGKSREAGEAAGEAKEDVQHTLRSKVAETMESATEKIKQGLKGEL